MQQIDLACWASKHSIYYVPHVCRPVSRALINQLLSSNKSVMLCPGEWYLFRTDALWEIVVAESYTCRAKALLCPTC